MFISDKSTKKTFNYPFNSLETQNTNCYSFEIFADSHWTPTVCVHRCSLLIFMMLHTTWWRFCRELMCDCVLTHYGFMLLFGMWCVIPPSPCGLYSSQEHDSLSCWRVKHIQHCFLPLALTLWDFPGVPEPFHNIVAILSQGLAQSGESPMLQNCGGYFYSRSWDSPRSTRTVLCEYLVNFFVVFCLPPNFLWVLQN